VTAEVVSHLHEPKERMPTILVVDDEVLIRMALSDFLQECGFKVLEAGNAEEAITILEQGHAVIDLVFSDVRMPGELDGFGLAKWIRENRKGLFLAKPYDTQMVLAQIRQFIDARKTK
jgi:CheY-like chemotaxis protein